MIAEILCWIRGHKWGPWVRDSDGVAFWTWRVCSRCEDVDRGSRLRTVTPEAKP